MNCAAWRFRICQPNCVSSKTSNAAWFDPGGAYCAGLARFSFRSSRCAPRPHPWPRQPPSPFSCEGFRTGNRERCAAAIQSLLAVGSARPLQQLQDRRCLAPVAGTAGLGPGSGFLRAAEAFLGALGLLPRLTFGGRAGRAMFRTGGLFIGFGPVAGCYFRGGGRVFDHRAHFGLLGAVIPR